MVAPRKLRARQGRDGVADCAGDTRGIAGSSISTGAADASRRSRVATTKPPSVCNYSSSALPAPRNGTFTLVSVVVEKKCRASAVSHNRTTNRGSALTRGPESHVYLLCSPRSTTIWPRNPSDRSLAAREALPFAAGVTGGRGVWVKSDLVPYAGVLRPSRGCMENSGDIDARSRSRAATSETSFERGLEMVVELPVESR